MPMTPRLQTNPEEDQHFAALAQAILRDGAASAGALEHGLRTEFPSAVVHVRELEGESWPTWYVYREGHWVGNSDREQPVSEDSPAADQSTPR